MNHQTLGCRKSSSLCFYIVIECPLIGQTKRERGKINITKPIHFKGGVTIEKKRRIENPLVAAASHLTL